MSRLTLPLRALLMPALTLLLAAALLLRLAAPTGWMPGQVGGSAALVFCPDAGSPPVVEHAAMAGMHHAPGHGAPDDNESEQPQPCAFASVFAATILPPVEPLLSPAPVVAAPIARRRPEGAPGRGLAAPPPPSRAPPVHLA